MSKYRAGVLFGKELETLYNDAKANQFDALIVDEAHRLNLQSGFYGNEGENQIKEIINATKCAIFFVDEDQRVTFKDIGGKQAIEQDQREQYGNFHGVFERLGKVRKEEVNGLWIQLRWRSAHPWPASPAPRSPMPRGTPQTACSRGWTPGAGTTR